MVNNTFTCGIDGVEQFYDNKEAEQPFHSSQLRRAFSQGERRTALYDAVSALDHAVWSNLLQH